jgi:perosamine synthetase
MATISHLAEKYKLLVIEDAAEAHGALFEGRKTGSLSDIAAFSFFANKNITTGEGGMVVSNNEELIKKARYHKNLCFPLEGSRNYTHDHIGFNYRMSNVIAAIGLAQTEKADEYKQMRIRNNRIYREQLKNLPGIVFQKETGNVVNVCWMNAIVIESNKYGQTRDELILFLKQNQVDSRLLFNGMHHQKSLMDYGCDTSGNYPVCDWLSQNGLYLPSASNLTEENISNICTLIKQFAKS